jgi:hypothetical protein
MQCIRGSDFMESGHAELQIQGAELLALTAGWKVDQQTRSGTGRPVGAAGRRPPPVSNMGGGVQKAACDRTWSVEQL